jgi:hypothetical protein
MCEIPATRQRFRDHLRPSLHPAITAVAARSDPWRRPATPDLVRVQGMRRMMYSIRRKRRRAHASAAPADCRNPGALLHSAV